MTHLTVIYDPKKSCSIGPHEEGDHGVYGVKPADSNNWDFIVEGCMTHLLEADPTTFQLDFQQYGKAIPVFENEEKRRKNEPMTKDHIKPDGTPAIYGPNYPIEELRGKPVKVWVFEDKRPKGKIISVVAADVTAYLEELGPKINPQV